MFKEDNDILVDDLFVGLFVKVNLYGLLLELMIIVGLFKII